MAENADHIPVLATEFIDAIITNPDGCYVDCTFGRGGHSRLLLQRLSQAGRLLAIDRDPDAIAEGEKLAQQDSRFQIAHAGFANLESILSDICWQHVTGIGFDLGVSSPQIDRAERGFSFKHDGPLDMRMNPNEGQSLTQRLDRVTEKDLIDIIRSYGDERFAGRIAKAILRDRKEGKLNTTADLENTCFHATPKQARYGNTHPATRTFQALRIWVNDEYGQIETGVLAAMSALAPQGRLAVISFHSGEDRRIRDLIEIEVNPCTCPPQFPICVCGKTPSMRWINKKPLRPSEEEVGFNPRSRSSKMRVAECVKGIDK